MEAGEFKPKDLKASASGLGTLGYAEGLPCLLRRSNHVDLLIVGLQARVVRTHRVNPCYTGNG